eukprot:scaffold950_cov360-Pavlova_lutheri.AAC.24
MHPCIHGHTECNLPVAHVPCVGRTCLPTHRSASPSKGGHTNGMKDRRRGAFVSAAVRRRAWQGAHHFVAFRVGKHPSNDDPIDPLGS